MSDEGSSAKTTMQFTIQDSEPDHDLRIRLDLQPTF